jgi:hypothetical protein
MASLAEDAAHLMLAGQAGTTENTSYNRVEATGDEDLQKSHFICLTGPR